MKSQKKRGERPTQDHVDRVFAQWAKELPNVDTHGAAVIGRARRITILSRKAIEENFARHGLDAGEFDVLATLRRSGSPFSLRPTELFRWLMISSGGLTARLERLEKSGLVKRRPAEDDARSLLVELTPAGKKTIEDAFRADMAIENKMVEALTAEEHSTLVSLLRKLALTLEE